MSRLDLVKKLEQLGHDHWMAIGTKLGGIDNVKAILKEYASVEVEITRRLSELKHGTALPARTDEFDPAFFEGDGVYTSTNFENFLIAHAKKVASVPETPVVFCDLVQPANDVEIQAELLENYVFDGADLFLPYLAGLIKRQKDGKVGDLLSNGYANIFYVRVDSGVFAVNMDWYSGASEWLCRAARLDGTRWNAGCRVFSATAAA